jgi:putative membrane protein
LLWRPFGWVRLEIVVASKQADASGSRQSRRVTRALLPVGTVTEAEDLLAALLPRGVPSLALPPKRSLLRAPFSYHFFGGGHDANYVVGSLGRVCRKVTIAPIEKAQSIRQVQGPLERLLGLASIYVDVAGRRGGVKMSSRDVTEASQLIERLTIDARAARTILSPRELQRGASQAEVYGP